MNKTIMGYKRSNKKFGIRNNVIIISLVQCANGTVTKIANKCDIAPITIDTGCGEFKDKAERTNLGLIRAGGHPNVYGVLLVSLGCQWINPEYIAGEIEKTGTNVAHLCIQDEGGVERTVKKGISIINEMKKEASAQKREECPFSDLVISVYCGGSDWTSSLAANNIVGEVSDLVIDNGGSSISCGVRGMPGNEKHMIDNAVNYKVGCQILEIVEEYRHDVFKMTGQSISDVNPTPGNKKGGVTTLCEKAVGNNELIGSSTIQGVLQVGDTIPYSGSWFVDNRQGGNDVYASTALAIGGSHIQLFTTGMGTPLGNAVMPVLKITGNGETFKILNEMIDYSGAPLLKGEKNFKQCCDELFDLLIETANGKTTKAEKLCDYSYVTPPYGKI